MSIAQQRVAVGPLRRISAHQARVGGHRGVMGAVRWWPSDNRARLQPLPPCRLEGQFLSSCGVGEDRSTRRVVLHIDHEERLAGVHSNVLLHCFHQSCGVVAASWNSRPASCRTQCTKQTRNTAACLTSEVMKLRATRVIRKQFPGIRLQGACAVISRCNTPEQELDRTSCHYDAPQIARRNSDRESEGYP